MTEEKTTKNLINRLTGLPKLSHLPQKELVWIVENGKFELFKPGKIIGPEGKIAEYLWIILSGIVAIRVDRGIGPKLVMQWHEGEVTGMLPYSRMKNPPGDNYTPEGAEAISISTKLFPEMIKECPVFTTYTVHSMLN